MRIIWALFICALLSTGSALNFDGIEVNFSSNDEELSDLSNQVADKYADSYVDYMKTGVESPKLLQLTHELFSTLSSKKALRNLSGANRADNFVACTTCRATFNVAARMFRDDDGELNGPNKDQDAKKAMLDICQRFNVATQEVCGGLFDIHWPVADFIIQNAIIDSRTICGTLPISFCKVKQNEFNWSLNVDNNGGANDKPKSEKPVKTDNDKKILHITDLHYDPEYKPGALAVCEEPLCCQKMPSGEVTTEKLAGYWSDYHICDAPKHMIENALDHIKTEHIKIDYIYHTGDVIPHIGWKTTEASNKATLTEINNLLIEKFPNIPIYPCLGNHDSHPSDLFSPEDVPDAINTKWLYNHIYTLWSKWLPADTKDTILKGGYYTVSPHSGFRIISLNNLDCYIHNWWLYYNGTYATQQLEWLHDTLLAAEKAGEFVHILAHVPTGEADCWTVWSKEFNRLVERFSPIISGIFNGHTHRDELNVHYTSKGNAVGVAWNAGSLTTYIGKNPNYRIYDAEPKSMQIVDFENWSFNLTAANSHGAEKKPEWFKLCHFSKDFTEDLSPAGIDALLEKMAENPDLLRKFWRCQMTAADPLLAKGCDNKCMLTTICHMARTSYAQKERCNELKEKLEKNLTPETTASPTTTTTNKPGDDGAASMVALQATTLVGLICLFKFLF